MVAAGGNRRNCKRKLRLFSTEPHLYRILQPGIQEDNAEKFKIRLHENFNNQKSSVKFLKIYCCKKNHKQIMTKQDFQICTKDTKTAEIKQNEEHWD